MGHSKGMFVTLMYRLILFDTFYLTHLTDFIIKFVDDGGEYAALCSCLPHDLLIVKLHAYGFDTPSLKLDGKIPKSQNKQLF